jgi:hypothetical protein
MELEEIIELFSINKDKSKFIEYLKEIYLNISDNQLEQINELLNMFNKFRTYSTDELLVDIKSILN